MTNNRDAPWDEFDATSYYAHNYAVLRQDDELILRFIRDYYSSCGLTGRTLNAVDVGAGSNMYPALALLPWVRQLDLLDFGVQNEEWLRSQVSELGDAWRPFWAVLRESPAYAEVDPQERLREVARVGHGDVFALPEAQWDAASMFFVAESLSDEYTEFSRALQQFVRCVRPGGHLVAAFMENSQGYDVGGTRFPAVPITESVLRHELAGLMEEDMQVLRIGIDGEALRPGYTGMLALVGRRVGSAPA